MVWFRADGHTDTQGAFENPKDGGRVSRKARHRVPVRKEYFVMVNIRAFSQLHSFTHETDKEMCFFSLKWVGCWVGACVVRTSLIVVAVHVVGFASAV